nr:MAG TPA: hypothetical protein [Caudoviricetes sp.]
MWRNRHIYAILRHLKGISRHYSQFPSSPPLKKDYRLAIVFFLRFYLHFYRFIHFALEQNKSNFSNILATFLNFFAF